LRKVKISLKRGVRQWSFTIYDTVESAIYLKTEPITDLETPDYRRTITLERGESLEAEWLGSEWIYDYDTRIIDGTESGDPRGFVKYEKVRMGKITPVKGLQRETIYLELYSGWVSGGTILWSKDGTQGDIRITPIKGRSVSKVDFAKVFADHPPEEDEDPAELFKDVPAILN